MKNPRFYALLDEIRATHDKKNADYASGTDPFSNFKECERMGLPAWKGCLVRMGDKWGRIMNLVEKKAQNEPIEDSLLDLAVYSMICLLLKRETK